MSWLLSNNRLEKVSFVSVPHTSSNRLLLSNQDKGCTPSVAHSLALPLGPALLNLWNDKKKSCDVTLCYTSCMGPRTLTLSTVFIYTDFFIMSEVTPYSVSVYIYGRDRSLMRASPRLSMLLHRHTHLTAMTLHRPHVYL